MSSWCARRGRVTISECRGRPRRPAAGRGRELRNASGAPTPAHLHSAGALTGVDEAIGLVEELKAREFAGTTA